MSWIEHHERSERLAWQAEEAIKEGRGEDAKALYARAGEAEERALAAVDPSKTRTLGITAVSAAALRYKAGQLAQGESVAVRWMEDERIPAYARDQLRDILREARMRKEAANRNDGAGEKAEQA